MVRCISNEFGFLFYADLCLEIGLGVSMCLKLVASLNHNKWKCCLILLTVMQLQIYWKLKTKRQEKKHTHRLKEAERNETRRPNVIAKRLKVTITFSSWIDTEKSLSMGNMLTTWDGSIKNWSSSNDSNIAHNKIQTV